MQQHFPSKRDGWIVAILWASALTDLGALLWIVDQDIAPAASLIAAAVLLPVAALTLWLALGTAYAVSDGLLRIASGPFRWRIPLEDIESVERTRSPLSSPALSLDRLRIRYGGGRTVLVSPADRRGFLSAIRQPVQ